MRYFFVRLKAKKGTKPPVMAMRELNKWVTNVWLPKHPKARKILRATLTQTIRQLCYDMFRVYNGKIKELPRLANKRKTKAHYIASILLNQSNIKKGKFQINKKGDTIKCPQIRKIMADGNKTITDAIIWDVDYGAKQFIQIKFANKGMLDRAKEIIQSTYDVVNEIKIKVSAFNDRAKNRFQTTNNEIKIKVSKWQTDYLPNPVKLKYEYLKALKSGRIRLA